MVLKSVGDWFFGPVRLPLKANTHTLFLQPPFTRLGARGVGGAMRRWLYPTIPPDPDYPPAGDLYTGDGSHMPRHIYALLKYISQW